MNSARRAVAFGVVVVLLGVVIGAYRYHHDRSVWTSDGAIYLRLTLQVRGKSTETARREANAFMRTTDEAAVTESRGFYGDAPPGYYRDQFGLFRNRLLYPALAAPLYGRFGPDALKLVSVAAYVVAVLIGYLVLLRFATAWIAAIGAAGLATSPAVVALAALPLTDELALAFWIGTLGLLFAYLRAPSTSLLIGVAIAAAALTLTRPAIYLPLGAAAGALIAAPRNSAQRGAALRAFGAFVLVGALYFVYTLLVHGPGIVEQLRWEYDWQHATQGPFASHGIMRWWTFTFAIGFATELAVDVYRHNALFTVALAAFGLIASRRSVVVPVVAGGAAATLVALSVNPVELQRTVTLPLTPLLIIAATIGLNILADHVKTRTRADAAASIA